MGILLAMTLKHSLYMQKYPSTIQKRPVCFFPVLIFMLEEKLCQEKCHKFYGPDGVLPFVDNEPSAVFCMRLQ